jgi:hypothetical protein
MTYILTTISPFRVSSSFDLTRVAIYTLSPAHIRAEEETRRVKY